MISIPDPQREIVDEDRKMFDAFRTWTLLVSRLDMFEGSGSPEGVLEADTKRMYMDTSGTAGSILYIKRDNDIGGDKSQGWILV